VGILLLIIPNSGIPVIVVGSGEQHHQQNIENVLSSPAIQMQELFDKKNPDA
jgi:hypothetical protein